LPAVQVKNVKPAFAIRAYRALMRYAAPLAPLMLAWRTRIGKEEPARRPERYGEASVARPPGCLVWFHAASVGEANAVLPVIDAIAAEHPEIGLLLTTGTVTSAKLARARLPKGAVHQYVPLDNQDYARRFLKHWQPDLAVFVESEIWPNLVLETNALNVPLVLVNGRMSFRSFRRWPNRPAGACQRPHVVPPLPPLAQPSRLEPSAVLGVRPGACPERALRPALHRARHASRRAGRQSQGRRADAPRGYCRPQEARRGARRPHGVARREHPSWRRRYRCGRAS